jgi:hypothetical protein
MQPDEDKRLREQIEKLDKSEAALKAAFSQGDISMAKAKNPRDIDVPVLDALAAQVAANVSAEQSAVILINGIASRIQTAVTNAIAGGASADQLAPIQAEVTALQTSATALAAAVVANTPAS